MADINKFSEQMIDLAERLADMSDAAKGKGGRRRSLGPKWVVLPAAGAVLYALATSGSFTRQDKGVMNQAKARASELPDDLLSRIRQTSQTSSSGTPASPAARPAPVARPTPPKPVPVADRLSNDR
jgi:hypothetical protein